MNLSARTLLIALIATSALACGDDDLSLAQSTASGEARVQGRGLEDEARQQRAGGELDETPSMEVDERGPSGAGESEDLREEDASSEVDRGDALDKEEETRSEEPEASEFIEAILALEGAQVIPQTLMHLESESANCEGQATTFEWRVTQPEGSVSVLIPNNTHPNPTFEANVAGDYTFELQSFDEEGALCVTPHRFTLSVTPLSAVHIELLWHTPGDPDESDEGPEAGADLDLHFIRQWPEQETPGWFEQPFDCFWFNPHPSWGSLDPTVPDDPSLDRDDTDGAGPENLNLGVTTEGVSYGVMVHQWNDHGYGDSFATIRVYIFGALSYEWNDVVLSGTDAWDVGTLTSDYQFLAKTTDAGEALIVKDFTHPMFMEP